MDLCRHGNTSEFKHDEVITLSPLLNICDGNPPVTGGFSLQRVSNAGL